MTSGPIHFWKRPRVYAVTALAAGVTSITLFLLQIGWISPSLFDGILGALIGALVSIYVLKTSIAGLNRQIRQQAHENDRNRERSALAGCITQVRALKSKIEAGTFSKPGRADSTFDAFHTSLAELELQMLENDPKLMGVINVWEEVLRERRNEYWWLISGEVHPKYEAEPENVLTEVAHYLDYLALQLAIYGRMNVMERTTVVVELANAVSDAHHRREEWWNLHAGPKMSPRAWDFKAPRPPIG